MAKIDDKSLKILSELLLSEKPLSTAEVAKITGYPRSTLDPYITRLIESGYLLDGGRDKYHGWIINEKYKQHVLDIVTTNGATIGSTLRAVEQKYGKNKWIHLIDADGTIPNLALMKISAWHKARGDRVTMSKGEVIGFRHNAPDKIYVSIIFKKNAEMHSDLASMFPDTEVDIGGSGIDLKKALLPEIELVKPDYDLYPRNKTSIGFASRGCIRNNKSCPWCIVPQKEGKLKRAQHPREWYNPAFKRIIFLDNNILGDKDWFFEITSWCLEKKLKIWFTQGLDVRLLDLQVAQRLFQFKAHHMLTFAWDDLKYEKAVRKGVATLREAGFTDTMLRAHIQFYVYVDSDADYDSGIYRCRELKKLGCNTYVMFNIDNQQTQRIIDLKRWSKGKAAFWTFDIADYNPQLCMSAKKSSHVSV
jgi:predicted transcriptional regulator